MCPSGRYPRAETTGISDFRQAFDVLDTDHDGKISQEDLRSFYSNGFSGENTTDDDIGTMISVADANKDGYVEFDEFEKVLGCRQAYGVMEEMFKVMDRDADGRVGFDDLRSYMNWAGFAANDEDIKAMIKLGGGDENEGVCYEGLMKILAVGGSGVLF